MLADREQNSYDVRGKLSKEFQTKETKSIKALPSSNPLMLTNYWNLLKFISAN